MNKNLVPDSGLIFFPFRQIILIWIFLIFGLFTNPVFANEKQTISKINIGWYFPSINATVSRTDFQVALDFWIQEFTKSVEVQHSEVSLFDHIDEMQTAFNRGELNIIVAPPLLIVKYFDLNKLADGFVGMSQNGRPYGMVVLARKDKNIKQIKEIKNKRLVLPENDELAEVFLDSLVISQFHQRYQQVFTSVKALKKHNAIIHSLFFDKADVGVAYLETFYLMAELNPQIADKLTILDNFPINSPNYSFFHVQFPEDERQIFIAEMLRLNHTVRTQQILNDFRMAALARCTVASLEPFIRLNQQYKQLQRQISN